MKYKGMVLFRNFQIFCFFFVLAVSPYNEIMRITQIQRICHTEMWFLISHR